jgi:signal transduction histidine kinase
MTKATREQNAEKRDVEVELQFAASLAEAAAVVNSSLDVEQVLDRILDQVARVVPGETYNIMLLEDDLGRIVRWRGYERLNIPDREIEGSTTPVYTYATFRQMLETGEPIVVNDTARWRAWVAYPDRTGDARQAANRDNGRQKPHQHRAYLGAPIVIAGEVEGFINVNASEPNAFVPQDAGRLRAFANHAAVALQNARLFEEKSHHTEELEGRVARRTEELNARAAWLEAILQSTSDGIIVTDARGEITQTNSVARAWLEHTLIPNDAAILRDTVKGLARQAEEQPVQLIELTGLDLELKAAPIVGSGTTPSAIVVAVHDVSHLKALDRMRSQFISDVSHELRTPIAAIRLYTSLLQQNAHGSQEHYLTSLEQALSNMTHLVEAILQIARIEAGRMEIETKHLDLNVVAVSAAESYRQAATNKGLELNDVIAVEPIPVMVDPHWFSQAVQHLMDNALKYTKAGSISVLTGVDEVDGRTWGKLTVKDTGIGIPQDEHERIFERFFRGDAPRTAQIPGSGLGLSIVKDVLNLHGGHVTFASREHEGSAFTLWVPLASTENCRIL